VDVLFKAIDECAAMLKEKRLTLDKMVKVRKDYIRSNIVLLAKIAFTQHVAD
jgi:hypothetical protein